MLTLGKLFYPTMSLSQNAARSLQRETSSIGSLFLLSNCDENVPEIIQSLKLKCENSTSQRIKSLIKSKINLICELKCYGYMQLSAAYDEYLAMIPEEFHPSYTQKKSAIKSFVDSILNKNTGIPVIIINCPSGERFIALTGTTTSLLQTIDKVINDNMCDTSASLQNLSQYWSSIWKLTNTAKERAILIATLSLLFSPRSLRTNLDIHEDLSTKTRHNISQCAVDMMNKECEFDDEAVKKWAATIKEVEDSLMRDQYTLEHSNSQDRIEKVNLEQDVQNKKMRLSKLKAQKEKYISYIAKLAIKKWKSGVMSQKGKGLGKRMLNPGAEIALFAALEEQMVAHSRRSGVPQIERRIQRREMRYIANEWLSAHGHALVKSYETARSWAKPKNKRSIQAKQHRGLGLFSHKKAAKSLTDEHINVHYNRAHVKYYTRMIFSGKTKPKFKHLTIRHCIDDKAYLRCGTSEGFSRPAHVPLVPTAPEKQPKLPAYDFPEKVGYVAPGVHLIIKDMKESERNGRDSYSIAEAKISVTCKPKMVYSSSATCWANDMYEDRLRYWKEHEVDGVNDNLPRDLLTPLIFIKDTARQYLMSDLKGDYERSCSGGEHIDREKLRVRILRERTEEVYQSVRNNPQLPDMIKDQIETCGYEAFQLEWQLDHLNVPAITCPNELLQQYEEVHEAVAELHTSLVAVLPEYRPIDVQTSDAGPGVGVSERMVRLRLVEHFIQQDLDMLVRIHYAPRDSKTHPVERVMAHLNDALGDGRFISVKDANLREYFSDEEVLSMRPEARVAEKEKLQQKAAIDCAKQAASRYQGTKCMGTTIDSHVAGDGSSPYANFFYDEYFMKKWLNTSTAKKDNSPGSFYYTYLEDMFTKQFIKYDNGIEGIKVEGEMRCPDVKRIPPPVPDLSSAVNGKWHYHTVDSMPQEYKDATNRQVNDFCPRTRLQKLIKDDCGQVTLQQKHLNDDNSVIDNNETWSKIEGKLSEFAENVIGKDLEMNAMKEAEVIYMRDVKQAVAKFIKLKEKGEQLTHEDLLVLKTGPLKLTIQRSLKPLPWNTTHIGIMMINTCTVDNFLMLAHILVQTRPDIKEYIHEHPHRSLAVLHDISALFIKGKFAEGKFLWLDQFEEFKDDMEQWDAHGTEDQYVYEKLALIFSSTSRSRCSVPTCPDIDQTTRIINYFDAAGVNTLQEGVQKWVTNNTTRPCTVMAQGIGCVGERTSTKRAFTEGLPFLLPIEVSNCALPIQENMEIENKRYTLMGVTYGNGGHFCSNLKMNNKWYFYDGLKIYHQERSFTQVAKIQCPQRYHQSYVLYVKDR